MYQTKDGLTKIEVELSGETVWLSLDQMAELFQRDKSTISKHIKNVYAEGELERNATVAKYATVQKEGNRQVERLIDYYNLDVIISVGYRVKSLRGTHFRIWATSVLKEYIIKGFAMNDDFLKKAGGGNYWSELLERIRDIRSSEKMVYRQVLDLYATSVDYDPKSAESREFFKIVQNKIHYAAHGHTAAEIVYHRVDAEKMNMGMTVFAGEQLTKSEASIAKNYLTKGELDLLNRMVSAFFDLAELRAKQQQPMYMKDWIAELDHFAVRYGKGILQHAGKVSHQDALDKAEAEFEKYRKQLIREITPVEREYLVGIKEAQKKLEKMNS
jgi:hypothetical protein